MTLGHGNHPREGGVNQESKPGQGPGHLVSSDLCSPWCRVYSTTSLTSGTHGEEPFS